MTATRLSRSGTGAYTPPPPFEYDLIIGTGQSNMWGVNPGLPGVTAGALYWDTDATSPTGVHSTFWHPLHGTGVHLAHGTDRSMGEQLLNAGYTNHLAILNVSSGSSPYTDWIPGAPVYNIVKAAIQEALLLLPAQFPTNATCKIRPLRNQGQTDARVNSLPYQQGWANSYTNQWLPGLQAMVAEVFTTPHTWKPSVIVGMSPNQTASFFVPTIIDQEKLAAVDEDHFIDGDGYGYEPDFVHMLGYPDVTGYVALGADIGDRIVYLDSIGQ